MKMRARKYFALMGSAAVVAFGGIAPQAAVNGTPPTAGSPFAALRRAASDESLSVSRRGSPARRHRRTSRTRRRPETWFRRAVSIGRSGIRNAPSIRYASFTPPFGCDKGKARRSRKSLPRQPRSFARRAGGIAIPRLLAKMAQYLAPTSLRGCADRSTPRLPPGLQSGCARRRGRGLLLKLAAAIAQFEVGNRIFTGSTAGYDTTLPQQGPEADAAEERLAFRLFEGSKGQLPGLPPEPAHGGRRFSTALHRFHLRQCGNAAQCEDSGQCRSCILRPRTLWPGAQDLATRLDLCGAFRGPRQLRNIARLAPYFHNGSFDNLRDVVISTCGGTRNNLGTGGGDRRQGSSATFPGRTGARST